MLNGFFHHAVKSANGNGAQPFSGNGNESSAQSENGASQKTAAHPHHHKPHYNLFSFPAEDNFAGDTLKLAVVLTKSAVCRFLSVALL